ncbi:cytochrome P450 [Elsinoe ampelina]|uniref:Cytochrome P450 n=1 Tax=Elsinoe ampelina TaxID=302913 RepID=A0A6A6G0B5_9PEZI|nr:cytochrome P450 [Elsinoe ampelina]
MIFAALTALLCLVRLDVYSLGLPVYDAFGDDNKITDLLRQGHRDYPSTPFALVLPGQALIVLPVSEIDTVKSLPDDQLSIKKHHHDQFLGEYSYMGTKADEFDATMRINLVRNTPTVLESFAAEVEYAFRAIVGIDRSDWLTVNPRSAMFRMASILSSRAFVGLPLSREPDWVAAVTTFTGQVSKAWLRLRFVPSQLHRIVGAFLSETRQLESSKAYIRQELAKHIAIRKNDKQGPGGELLDWLPTNYTSTPTLEDLTRDLLLVIFASIYNLSNALTYAMFDLADRPDIVQELREELLQVVGAGGQVDKSNVGRLRKMDSFLRESQRLSPPSLVNIPRIVTAKDGLELSTGHTIPMGSRVMIRAQPINMSESLWPDPETFKPWRFAALRAQEGQNENRFQHTSTGSDNINFGHGVWACPGRFFASAQLKVVFAHLIMHYDIRMPDGLPKPQPKYAALAIFPNAEANIELRTRID